ncbi:family 43 glycosylhydrolase, partial [Raoultella terrigena]|uniref:family 43 glycosylhydrolase n=1 Tax=Raoultella terrigena TaxID=577 RepID=UPI00133074F2
FLWAPGVATARGKWYLYYSVGPQNPTPSRIGVAVADRPEGPYRDSGKPLVTGELVRDGRGFEAIDPMVFVDPRSGKAYLYTGGSAGARLRVWELNRDMISLAREVPVAQPPQFTEGAFMHERAGTYYLSYSHGRFNGPD